MLDALLPILEAQADWSVEGLKTRLTEAAETLAVKNAKLLWPLRIAVSGRALSLIHLSMCIRDRSDAVAFIPY